MLSVKMKFIMLNVVLVIIIMLNDVAQSKSPNVLPNVSREIGQLFPMLTIKCCHSGGGLAQQNWHHLGQANSTGMPPDQKSKQSLGANLSLYKH